MVFECLAQSGYSIDICQLNEIYGVSNISMIMPIFQIKKVRLRKVKKPIQGHTVKIKDRISNSESTHYNLSLFCLNSVSLPYFLFFLLLLFFFWNH